MKRIIIAFFTLLPFIALSQTDGTINKGSGIFYFSGKPVFDPSGFADYGEFAIDVNTKKAYVYSGAGTVWNQLMTVDTITTLADTATIDKQVGKLIYVTSVDQYWHVQSDGFFYELATGAGGGTIIKSENELILANNADEVKKTWVITDTITLTQNITIDGAEIQFRGGAIIDSDISSRILRLDNVYIDNGNRRIFGDSVTVQFWEQSQPVNAVWFGAKGDRSFNIDDARRNSRAIGRAAGAASVPLPGANDHEGTLYIPKGVYLVDSIDLDLYMSSRPLTIMGDGLFSTFIEAVNDTIPYVLKAIERQFNLEDLTFAGRGSVFSNTIPDSTKTPYLVRLRAYGSYIKNVGFNKSTGDGLYIERSQAYTLDRVYASQNWGYGINIEDHYGTYVYSPWCEYNYKGGILIKHTYEASDLQRERKNGGNMVIGGSFEGIGQYGTSQQFRNPEPVAAVHIVGSNNNIVETGTEQITPDFYAARISLNPDSDEGYRSATGNYIHFRNNRNNSNVLIDKGNYFNYVERENSQQEIIDSSEMTIVKNSLINDPILLMNQEVGEEFLPTTYGAPSGTSALVEEIINPLLPEENVTAESIIPNANNQTSFTVRLDSGNYFLRLTYLKTGALGVISLQDVDASFEQFSFEDETWSSGSGAGKDLRIPECDNFQTISLPFVIPPAKHRNLIRYKIQLRSNSQDSGKIIIAHRSISKKRTDRLIFQSALKGYNYKGSLPERIDTLEKSVLDFTNPVGDTNTIQAAIIDINQKLDVNTNLEYDPLWLINQPDGIEYNSSTFPKLGSIFDSIQNPLLPDIGIWAGSAKSNVNGGDSFANNLSEGTYYVRVTYIDTVGGTTLQIRDASTGLTQYNFEDKNFTGGGPIELPQSEKYTTRTYELVIPAGRDGNNFLVTPRVQTLGQPAGSVVILNVSINSEKTGRLIFQDPSSGYTDKGVSLQRINSMETQNPRTSSTIQTSDFTAEIGVTYQVDCSSGPITITPPSSPPVNGSFRVIDVTSNAGSNNITLGFQGSGINVYSQDTDYIINYDAADISFTYHGVTTGFTAKQ